MTAVKPLALAACLALSLVAPAHAASLAGRADVDAFIEQMVRNHGVNRDQLSATLLQADTKPSMPVLGNGGVLLEPEDRLKSLQLQLTSLTGIYSDDHPDIKRLRREIATDEHLMHHTSMREWLDAGGH